MQFIKGKNIPLTLQLIKSDNSYEDSATISYEIYDKDLSTILVSSQSAEWNSSFNCYFDELNVSTNWINQIDGNFILKWDISDTILFPETMIESICILPNSELDNSNLAELIMGGDSTSGYDIKLISDKLDIVQNDLNNPDQYKADVSSLATEVNASSNKNEILTEVNSNEIKIDAIQADLNNPDQYKADISGLSTSLEIQNLQSELIGDSTNNIDLTILSNKLDIVQNDLNNPDQYKADVSGLSTSIELENATQNIIGSDSTNLYNLEIISDKLDIVQNDLNNPDQYKADVSGLSTLGEYDLRLATLQTDLKRVLGLLHENIYIDNPIYDENNNLISSRVRIYSDSASVGTSSNVIGSYVISSIGDGLGKFTSWSQVKV